MCKVKSQVHTGYFWKSFRIVCQKEYLQKLACAASNETLSFDSFGQGVSEGYVLQFQSEAAKIDI